MRDFEALNLKWDVFISPHLPRLKDLCRRGRKGVRARNGVYLQRNSVFRHNRTGAQKNKHTETVQHAQDLQRLKLDEVPSLTKKNLQLIPSGEWKMSLL